MISMVDKRFSIIDVAIFVTILTIFSIICEDVQEKTFEPPVCRVETAEKWITTPDGRTIGGTYIEICGWDFIDSKTGKRYEGFSIENSN